MTLDADGEVAGEMRYYPFGEVRTASGSMWTDQLFTGQRALLDLGIYHYNARFYSPALGRFLNADTVVPGAAQSQAYDRYAYVMNSPLVYSDPSGHWGCSPGMDGGRCGDKAPVAPAASIWKPTPTVASTPKPVSNQPRIEIITKFLGIGSIAMDIGALGLSSSGVILEAMGGILGESLTPIPGVDGFIGAIGFYNISINPIENILSTASAGLVAFSDLISNQTRFEETDSNITGQPATELVIGADTTFSLASLLVGNNQFFTPEGITDTIANGLTV